MYLWIILIISIVGNLWLAHKFLKLKGDELNCKNEIDYLSKWIYKNCPEEIGQGDSMYGESAVDISIRIMRHTYPPKNN